MITIIDIDSGNLNSLKNALSKLNVESEITNEKHKINNTEKLILPGVGSFDKSINFLIQSNLIDLMNEKVQKNKIPILGICVGMQIMTYGSEEGKLKGLSWIEGYTKRFKKKENLKIPHVGWNNVIPCDLTNKMSVDIKDNSKFYFCHSYYVEITNKKESICKTNYGIEFDSVFGKNNIYGCQFHPEKSHDKGLVFLNNFVNI